VKVASTAARALEDLKYDAALAPLPEGARVVLDQVMREKAWNRNRLAALDAWEQSRG
jgi:hypothetical protein